MGNASIETLVLTAQSGMITKATKDAFGELTVMHRKMVMGVATRYLGVGGDAEDLVQDVFIHAMKKISQLRDANTFGEWLRVIAVRKAINYLRQRKLVKSLDHMEGHEPIAVENTWEHYDQVETHDLILKAIGELGKNDREILDAFYMKGYRIKEIAETFDIPEGTAKRRLFEARKRLKKVLQDSSKELQVA
ncbi:MAG: RNA polymerase sigma factor [Gemmataceae bacterium]